MSTSCTLAPSLPSSRNFPSPSPSKPSFSCADLTMVCGIHTTTPSLRCPTDDTRTLSISTDASYLQQQQQQQQQQQIRTVADFAIGFVVHNDGMTAAIAIVPYTVSPQSIPKYYFHRPTKCRAVAGKFAHANASLEEECRGCYSSDGPQPGDST
uniref:Uncharacterized protein n=1 Tax=Leersia perrieri TaxID=77586 RepID=A0A0D9WNW1_9ORYZ